MSTSMSQRLRDVLALTKPTITAQCAVVAGLGLWLAPVPVAWERALGAVVGICSIVAAAGALNMWVERESDGLMARTKYRPLPSGRMPAAFALGFGSTLSMASLALLWWTTNPLTTVIALLSLILYVAVYTPLKRRTPLALVIGAFPGAAPILMGWTAATNQIDPAAWVLFGILGLWQMPHFLAIALFRKAEYARAGIKVVPVVQGERAAIVQAIIYSTALVPLSLALVPLGVAGWFYAAVALAAGLWMVVLSIQGMRAPRLIPWARKLFVASLVYVPALTFALVFDAWTRG